MDNSNFDWTTEVEYCGEQLKPDEFGRSKYASYLTDLLINKSLKGNYVLNLNSEWGSGKTYFIKRWAKELESTHPVVYIDAWKQDYSDDPLLTVISSIVSQLKAQAGVEFEQLTQKVFDKIVGLFKATAPALTGAIVKKHIGFDINELREISRGEDSATTVVNNDGKPIDLSIAASAMVSNIIKEHEEKGKSIEELKTAIDEWIGAVIGKSGVQSPAFIFVDELDRCRPSYAVEMLETIKHLFNVPRAVFIIATDTEQLQHAIKVIYGDEFEAGAYLGRFFNARYALNRPSFKSYFCSAYGSELGNYGINDSLYCHENISVMDNLSSIADGFFKSVRDVNKVMERLLIVVDQVKDFEAFDIYYIFILICIFESRHDDFDKVVMEPIFKSNDMINHDWFKQFSNVDWNRKVDLYINSETLAKLVPSVSGGIIGRFDSGAFSTHMITLFSYAHSVYQRDGTYTMLIKNEQEKVEGKFDNYGRLRNLTPGTMLSVSHYADSYIKLFTERARVNGYNLRQCLDIVNMSHSFEHLS